MPSTPPPLSSSLCCVTAWRASPLDCSDGPARINWPAVLVSVSVSFTLVAGVFAWIATHPHKTALPQETAGVAFVQLPFVPSSPPPTLPQAPAVKVTPVCQQSCPRDTLAFNIPPTEQAPPLLPSPTSPPPKQHEDDDTDGELVGSSSPPRAQDGETYGTQVLFLNNRESAARVARNEHKLLFVMHISGNFEDSCFT